MIKMVNEYKLELTSAPFAQEDSAVYYVRSGRYPEMDSFVETHIAELRHIFLLEGLTFEVLSEGIGSDIDGHTVESTIFSPGISAPTERGTAYCAYHLECCGFFSDDYILKQFKNIAKVYSRRNAICYRQRTEDREIANLLGEMDKIARSLIMKGVKPDLFSEMLRSLERPSEMIIASDRTIRITDFRHARIRLRPMQMTLYVFVLNHPDGILPDEMVGYRNEILDIYRGYTPYSDEEAIELCVDSLLAEDKTVLYSTVSHIKSAFTSGLGETIAKKYIIVRDAEGKYTIELPRSYISYYPPLRRH